MACSSAPLRAVRCAQMRDRGTRRSALPAPDVGTGAHKREASSLCARQKRRSARTLTCSALCADGYSTITLLRRGAPCDARRWALLSPLAQPSQGCAAGSGATRLPGCAAIRKRTKTAVLRRECARLAALRAAAPPASAASERRVLSPACARWSPAWDSAPAQTTACSCRRPLPREFVRLRGCAVRCTAAFPPWWPSLGWCSCFTRAQWQFCAPLAAARDVYG